MNAGSASLDVTRRNESIPVGRQTGISYSWPGHVSLRRGSSFRQADFGSTEGPRIDPAMRTQVSVRSFWHRKEAYETMASMKELVLGWPGALVGCIGALGMLLTLHSRWCALFCLLLLAESGVGLWYRVGRGKD